MMAHYEHLIAVYPLNGLSVHPSDDRLHDPCLPGLRLPVEVWGASKTATPSLIKIDETADKRDSHDINFHAEWQLDWLKVKIRDLVTDWQS